MSIGSGDNESKFDATRAGDSRARAKRARLLCLSPPPCPPRFSETREIVLPRNKGTEAVKLAMVSLDTVVIGAE